MVSQSTSVVDRIFEALKSDSRTKDVMVEIVNNHGTVTLSGVVNSAATRDTVEEIARRQPGVMIVINELSVR